MLAITGRSISDNTRIGHDRRGRASLLVGYADRQ